MIYECPKCGGAMITHKKVKHHYGLYIQWRCKDCNHRESQTAKSSPDLKPHPSVRRNSRKFDDETIKEIRASTESNGVLAERYRCSRRTITRIKTARYYKLPENETKVPSCTICRFWDFEQERCKEGWPDPLTDGPSYAKECLDFTL